jgi:RNA polymerase sigma factor (TIGR02999 family)
LSGEAYEKLLRSARSRLRHFPSGELDAVSLVSECWLKLRERWPQPPQRGDDDRYQATASVAMQQILIDYQRRRTAAKRGAGATHLSLNEQVTGYCETEARELSLDLHRAVGKLKATSPRQARVLLLRVVGGLTNDETARRLGRSLRSTERDWARARRRVSRLIHA